MTARCDSPVIDRNPARFDNAELAERIAHLRRLIAAGQAVPADGFELDALRVEADRRRAWVHPSRVL